MKFNLPIIGDECDFPAFKAYCLEDYILHIEFKKIKELNAKDVEQVYECHKKIGGSKDAYVLVTFSGYIPLSDEAMTYAKKKSKESPSAATAYVVKNFALRIGIKFFMNFYKPGNLINICTSKAEGISWLKSQKKKMRKKMN